MKHQKCDALVEMHVTVDASGNRTIEACEYQNNGSIISKTIMVEAHNSGTIAEPPAALAVAVVPVAAPAELKIIFSRL